MNIRSLSNPAQVLAKEEVTASKHVRSSNTDEREANGQQPFSEPEAHRPLTDEELETVIAKFVSNEGIQKSGLIVRAFKENNQNIIKIETADGKIVKRFVERDLYFYLFQGSKDEFQLVNKTA